MGRTVEVDVRTQKEFLKGGRVKVLLNSSVTMPLSVPVWVKDLKFIVTLEAEEGDIKHLEERERRERYEDQGA